MASKIHRTAIVDKAVELGERVQIGAYAVLKGRIVLEDDVSVDDHCILHGPLRVGKRGRIGPAAHVGLPPQHLHFEDVENFAVIGDDAWIREGCTIHRSTRQGLENATRIGSHVFMMANAHVAHDCVVGDRVVMANAVLLGGHVHVGDGVFLGGSAGIHQYVRIGRLSIIGGNETITKDVPPFAAARFGGLKGYNAIGCRRAGLMPQAISAIRAAHLRLHRNRGAQRAIAAIQREVPDTPEVRELIEFLATSRRGILASVWQLRALALPPDDMDE